MLIGTKRENFSDDTCDKNGKREYFHCEKKKHKQDCVNIIHIVVKIPFVL